MENESVLKYFIPVFVFLFGTIFTLVAWGHGQGLVQLQQTDARTDKEVERQGSEQRDVADRLARVETKLENLGDIVKETKIQSTRNAEKLDTVIQLLQNKKKSS